MSPIASIPKTGRATASAEATAASTTLKKH
jgi:hypothetical protein